MKRNPSILLPAWIVAIICARLAGSDLESVRKARDQRLYRAAARQCLELLRKPGLSNSDSASITVELLKTYLNHVLDASPNEQSKLWEQIENTVNQFRVRHKNNSHKILVDVQFSIGLVLKAELERFKAEISSDDQPAILAARTAIDELRKVEGSLKTVRASRPEGLSIAQLQRIRFKVEFELGRAYFNLALCYPVGGADYVNALTKSLSRYQPLARLRTQRTLAMNARLAEARCHRKLGNFSDANSRVIALVSNASLSQTQRLATVTERARLLLDRREIGPAIMLLDKTSHSECRDQGTVADFFLTKVEAYTQLVLASKNKNEIETFKRKTHQTLELMKQQFSTYWIRRGELSIASWDEPGKSATFRRQLQADQLYREGKADQAIVAYSRAAKESLSSGNMDAYISLNYKAAVIEHKAKKYRQAMARMLQVSTLHPNSEGAAKGHYLAIVDAAQLAKSNQPVDVENYIQALVQHLDLWPRGPNADQVRFWLARIRLRQQQWQEAIETLEGISIDWVKFQLVLTDLLQAYHHWIRRSSGEQRNLATIQAIRYFSDVSRRVASGNSTDKHKLRQQADLARLEIQLMHHSNSLAANEQELRNLLSSSSRHTSDQVVEVDVARLIVLCYALQRKTDLAIQLLPSLATCPASRLVPIALRIDDSLKTAPRTVIEKAARLILELSVLIEKNGEVLSPHNRMATEILHAKALAMVGQNAEAVARFSALIEQHPADLDLRITYARILQQGDSPEQSQLALEQWRMIANGSRPGTDGWFQAKYATAVCLYRLDRKAKAAELIRLTSTLHPKLGGPALKSKFSTLLAKCSE